MSMHSYGIVPNEAWEIMCLYSHDIVPNET